MIPHIYKNGIVLARKRLKLPLHIWESGMNAVVLAVLNQYKRVATTTIVSW